MALMTELQDHVKSTTAPYKYPRKIEFVESLPKVSQQEPYVFGGAGFLVYEVLKY